MNNPTPPSDGAELAKLRQKIDEVLSWVKSGKVEQGHAISLIVQRTETYATQYAAREAAKAREDAVNDMSAEICRELRPPLDFVLRQAIRGTVEKAAIKVLANQQPEHIRRRSEHTRN